MYSCLSIGTNGKFGNQMFQYAAAFSLAKKHSEDLYILDSRPSPTGGREKYELLEAFSSLEAKIISHDDDCVKSITGQYREPSFTFDSNLSLVRSNTDIHGYFQSELYFREYREDLLRQFSFSSSVLDKCQKRIKQINEAYQSSNICAVHVRRGDYQNLSDYHTNMSSHPEYYSMSMGAVSQKLEGTKFIVFSDDIDWCKNTFPDDVIFSDMSNHFEDMCLMSLCNSHIIANSSFSWWGAWLSNSKLVIAPRMWFGPKGPSQWNTIYAAGWYVA